jgi:hypothetical protein
MVNSITGLIQGRLPCDHVLAHDEKENEVLVFCKKCTYNRTLYLHTNVPFLWAVQWEVSGMYEKGVIKGKGRAVV